MLRCLHGECSAGSDTRVGFFLVYYRACGLRGRSTTALTGGRKPFRHNQGDPVNLKSFPPSATRKALVPVVAMTLVCGTAAPAMAQSDPGSLDPTSIGNIGSITKMGGSVDPSSAAAGSATVGSTGSTGTHSLEGLGTLPPIGTGSQNTSATPPIGMEAEPIETTKVRNIEIGDPMVAGGDPRFERWWIESKSMNRILPVEIWRASSDAPAPMLYLLDGVDSPSPSGWLLPGHIQDVFADEHVTLVMPTRADGSLHADWQHDDPVLSRNKWQTFLTQELPPLLESGEHAIPFNGKRGMAGLSMGAASAVTTAERAPSGMYQAVGAIAGCYTARDDLGFLLAKIVAETRGGNMTNMWGPRGSQQRTMASCMPRSCAARPSTSPPRPACPMPTNGSATTTTC